jgi:hypothetical protein
VIGGAVDFSVLEYLVFCVLIATNLAWFVRYGMMVDQLRTRIARRDDEIVDREETIWELKNCIEDLPALNERIRHLNHEVASGASALKSEVRKGEELFKTIESVLKERDGWRDLYYVEASEHGNAQRQLLEERGRLIYQLQKAKLNPIVNLSLERMVAEFREKHAVDPAAYEAAKAAQK